MRTQQPRLVKLFKDFLRLGVHAAAIAGLSLSSIAIIPAAPVAASATEYNSAVQANSPDDFWPMDEASSAGSIADAMGFASNSTTTTCTLGDLGSSGAGIACDDSSSQHIEVGYISRFQNSNSFSSEIWAKLPASGAGSSSSFPTLYSRGNPNSGHFGQMMWFGNTDHQVRLKRNGIDINSGVALKADHYTHLVFVFASTTNTWLWYADGSLVASGTNSSLNGTDTETAPLEIGAERDTATGSIFNYANIRIDGLALYDSALSDTNVSAHYHARHHVGGIAYGSEGPYLAPSDYDQDFQAMEDAGATWVRFDLDWWAMEPSHNTWAWSNPSNVFEPFVADAISHGLSPLAILHITPDWDRAAGTTNYTPPTHPAYLTNYCYQSVMHWQPLGIHDFQIGNEVNLAHDEAGKTNGWTPTASFYKQYLWDPCYAGITAAETDLGTSVNVMLGSVVHNWTANDTDPVDFMSDVYATSGWKNQFTSVAYHPYTGGVNPWQSSYFIDDAAAIYGLMSSHSDGAKKIWATEFGESTCTPSCNGVSEQQQAAEFDAAFDVWYARSWAGPLLAYTIRDTGTGSTQYENFGLLKHNGVEKAAYDVVASRLAR